MTEYGKLTREEFEKRCDEVFFTQDNEGFYDIRIEDDRVKIQCEETIEDENGSTYVVHFDYEPDMSDRPESLDYLMGKRNDFND